MNQQDQQAIEELFQHLYQTTEQTGPRDGAAEALIQRYVQAAPSGLLYRMAQTLVAQHHTLNQLRSQLAAYQRQGRASAGFDYQGQDPGAFDDGRAFDDGGAFDDNGFGGGFDPGGDDAAIFSPVTPPRQTATQREELPVPAGTLGFGRCWCLPR